MPGCWYHFMGFFSGDRFPPMPPFPGNKGTIQGQELPLVENPLKRSYLLQRGAAPTIGTVFHLQGVSTLVSHVFSAIFRVPMTPLITKL